jgi:hypothetical protein
MNLLVWNKSNAGQGSFYRSKHELIAVFTPPRSSWTGLKNQCPTGFSSRHPPARGSDRDTPPVGPPCLCSIRVKCCGLR